VDLSFFLFHSFYWWVETAGCACTRVYLRVCVCGKIQEIEGICRITRVSRVFLSRVVNRVSVYAYFRVWEGRHCSGNIRRIIILGNRESKCTLFHDFPSGIDGYDGRIGYSPSNVSVVPRREAQILEAGTIFLSDLPRSSARTDLPLLYSALRISVHRLYSH